MKSRNLTLLCCFFALLSIFSAERLEALAASVKATGMGAVGVSYPQDTLVVAYNPAGIVDICDRIDFELVYARDKGSATVYGNQSRAAPLVNGNFNAYHTKEFLAPSFGVSKRFCYGNFEFAAGLIVFNRTATKTTYKKPFPLLGTSPLGMEYIHETISPVIAAKYCNISVGITLNYMLQRFKVNGIENFDNPRFSSSPGNVTNRGYAYSNGVGLMFGVKWDIIPCLSVGAAFQPTTTMNNFGKYKGFLAQKGLLKIPPIGNAGVTWRFLPCASATFEVQYLGWNRCRCLNNPLVPNFLTARLGDESGAGFGFRSQWVYRVGADWDINNQWTVRAGARFAKASITPPNTAVNLLTCDTVGNYAMAGFSYRPKCNVELSFYYAHGFNRLVKGKDSIPLLFGGGEVNLRQEKDAFGFALGYNY